MLERPEKSGQSRERHRSRVAPEKTASVDATHQSLEERVDAVFDKHKTARNLLAQVEKELRSLTDPKGFYRMFDLTNINTRVKFAASDIKSERDVEKGIQSLKIILDDLRMVRASKPLAEEPKDVIWIPSGEGKPVRTDPLYSPTLRVDEPLSRVLASRKKSWRSRLHNVLAALGLLGLQSVIPETPRIDIPQSPATATRVIPEVAPEEKVRFDAMAKRPKQNLGGLTEIAEMKLRPEFLDVGSKGRGVEALQRFLAKYGYYPVEEVDGRFGPRTHEALTAFQIECKRKGANIPETGKLSAPMRRFMEDTYPSEIWWEPATRRLARQTPRSH